MTYSPVTGADFARTFLAPMQPADLFGLMVGGIISPELVLGLGLHSIGGYANERASPERADRGRPEIREVLALLLELQRTGRLSVQLEVAGQARLGTLEIGVGDREDASERRLRQLLALAPDQTTFPVTYTLCAARPGQIAIRTRSPIEVLDQLAGDVDAPDDVANGSTYAAFHSNAWRNACRVSWSITVCSSRAAPTRQSATTAPGSGSATMISPPSACSAS